MSYIKVHIPERYQLKKQLESDRDKWIKYYAKYGAPGLIEYRHRFVSVVGRVYSNRDKPADRHRIVSNRPLEVVVAANPHLRALRQLELLAQPCEPLGDALH